MGRAAGGGSRPIITVCQLWHPGVALLEIEREADGRWIGEVAELPRVQAYGAETCCMVGGAT